MIKKYALILIVSMFYALNMTAQNLIPIPDTLSGTDIHLYLKDSSKTFFTGVSTQTIGYNGSYLGKTIILQKGQNVTLNVHNQLADTSTTHWHGLHVAPKNDGSPHNIIKAGQTWSPSFKVMDNAATYWYHPHLHGKTMAQVVKGAAGLIIVRDDTEGVLPLPRTYGKDDIPLVLQFQTIDNTSKQIVIDDENDNVTMVNGTLNPFVNCPAQVVRLRLLNASSHRVFQLGFSDNRAFYQIASDAGLLNAPVQLTRLQLGSGERAEILVNLTGLSGKTLDLQQFGNELPTGYPAGPPMIMGGGSMNLGILDNKTFTVLQLKIGSSTTNAITTIPTILTTNTTPLTTGADTRSFLLEGSPMMSMTNFVINGNKFDEHRMDFKTDINKTMVWEIRNQSMMAHPFHIHGNSFYILSINGVTPPANMLGKKDVVIVPPQNGVVRLVTKYEDFADATMPYMFHCHILSHEDGGMMGQFVVSPLASATHDMPEDATIRIYPNPIQNSQNVIIEAENAIQSVSVFDILGRKIAIQQGLNAQKMSIATPFDNGLYLFEIQTDKGMAIKKVTITN
jgi:blue copper oxidase